MKNKDFYNYEIRDSEASLADQIKQATWYMMPKPFSITSATTMSEQGQGAGKVAMSFLGMNKAPGYLTHSDIENEIFDLYNIRNAGTKPYAEKESNDAKAKIREMYKSGNTEDAEVLANEYVEKGVIRPAQLKYLMNHAATRSSPSEYFFKSLPHEDKVYLYNKMTDAEKEQYDPKGKLRDELQER
jgi:hypothetical protein